MSLSRVAMWFGAAAVFYVIILGILVEYGAEYYSFSKPEGKKKLLLHGLVAMPILALALVLLEFFFD